MQSTICPICLDQAVNLVRFNRVIGVQPCIETDENGNQRQSYEPVLADDRDICYPCYKEQTKKYLRPISQPVPA